MGTLGQLKEEDVFSIKTIGITRRKFKVDIS